MANPIDSERKRKALEPRSQPYRFKIKPLHYIAYRRNNNFDGGKWIAIFVRAQHALGLESDLNYSEALELAMVWFDAVGGDGDSQALLTATVDTAIVEYVKHLRVERTDRAANETNGRIRKYASPALLKSKLATLTTRQVKAFRDGMVKDDEDPEVIRKSKDSANRVMNMLKAALNLSYRNGMVNSDAAWKRVESFRNVGKARILFLTDEQVDALLESTTGGLHNLIELAVHTGARYGELCTARVGDFDAVEGTLYLNGKTGSRTAYLSDSTVSLVKRLVKRKFPTAPLLMQDDGRAFARDSLRWSFRAAARAAKLPEEAVFYSLRHYHISKALLAGVNAQVIAENCGTSTRMIEQHYGKFLKADRRAMFNMVNVGGDA